MFWNKKIQAEKLVMAFGSFDYLHAGHENFLRQARELGDYLLVVLALDSTIKSIKGQEPMYSQKERLKTLQNTGWTNQVILGNYKDKHQVILQHQPAIIALGYDQFAFTQTLSKTIINNQLQTEIVRLMPYFPQVYKSSLLKIKATETEKENILKTNSEHLA